MLNRRKLIESVAALGALLKGGSAAAAATAFDRLQYGMR
jgi:hypothetical protein